MGKIVAWENKGRLIAVIKTMGGYGSNNYAVCLAFQTFYFKMYATILNL